MKIARLSIPFLVVFAVLFASPMAIAQEHAVAEGNDEGPVNTDREINDYIEHHIKDSHDFHLYSYTDAAGVRQHVGFPLPVILWASEGPVAFMSSAFHHDVDGEVVVEAGGSRFVNHHDKIYELNEGDQELVMAADGHHPVNASKPLDLSISKSVLGILIIGLLMLIWFSGLARQYKTKKIPTGFGRVLEPLVIYVRDEIAKPNIGSKYRKFTGYLMTVFFFIWISNLLGLTPFGFNVTGQIAVTAALAIFTLIIYLASGNKDFWMHMVWMPGVPYIFRPVLAVIELAGAFLIKPFALLVRLFANISAGHIVVMSLIAIMITLKGELSAFGSTTLSFVLSLFITLIEVLVAFLQAYIFTMLSALFIGMAVADHDHEDHGEAEGTEVSRSEFI